MQITSFTDQNLFANNLVSAQKHQMNIPQLKDYSIKVKNRLISPNGNLIAIMQQRKSQKENKEFHIVLLYNVINGEVLYEQTFKEEHSLTQIQFSFDSSLFFILDTENLYIINVQEMNNTLIIKLKCKRLISIDTDNNISLLLSNNDVFVYSTKNKIQYTFQFKNDIDYLQMIGINYAIYSCGMYQYLLNVQNKKVLNRWMNHQLEIIDQINYRNFLVLQSSGFNIKFVYIRLQQSGKIIRKYFNNTLRQGQNRISYDNSSIWIFSFVYCRIKQPILNVKQHVFKIEMIVKKFDLLQGGQKQYNFQIDHDYDLRKEIPIYLLKDNQLKYYLFI